MRALVTGATGFVGGRLAALLRARGDDVVALVRAPARAERLRALGFELAAGDLLDRESLAAAARGCDAVFHAAAIYRIGLPERERARLFAVNVAGTENVLDAARAAAVARVVYVSTNSVLGNTHGELVDERHVRPGGGWLSLYDESKYRAHVLVAERIARGESIAIAQPGGVYGPGDHTLAGALLRWAVRGRPLLLPLGDTGLNWAHVDDVAAGIALVHDRGRLGETYILGGESATLRRAVETAYRVGGYPPRVVGVPTRLVRLAVPLGPLLRLDVRDVLSAAAGVTYYGDDAKARRELGYRPAGLAEGLRRTFAR